MYLPLLTDLISELPVAADADASFPRMSTVPVVAGFACLDAVLLDRPAVIKSTYRRTIFSSSRGTACVIFL